jgi:hypothetical protein
MRSESQAEQEAGTGCQERGSGGASNGECDGLVRFARGESETEVDGREAEASGGGVNQGEGGEGDEGERKREQSGGAAEVADQAGEGFPGDGAMPVFHARMIPRDGMGGDGGTEAGNLL